MTELHSLMVQKFFSVANKHNRMTRAECNRVYQLQQQRRRMGLESPKCGQLAVELGILSDDSRQETLKDLEGLRATKDRLRDPIEDRGVYRGKWASARARKVIMVLLAIGVLAVGAFTKSVAHFASAASLAGFFWLVRSELAPQGLRGRIRWDRAARLLVLLCAGVSLTYCLYLGYETYLFAHLPASTNPILIAGALWTRFFGAVFILGVVALYFFGLSMFRRQEVKDLTNRIELSRGLVHAIYEGMAGNEQGGNAGESIRADLTAQILRTTGDVLRLNPWDRLLSFVLPRRRPMGAPCLWYLEPCTEPKDGFEIKCFAVPGATPETVRVFEQIQREHRPKKLNKKRYEEEIDKCFDGDTFDSNKFLAITDREDFVSLTGFVHEYGHGIVSGDVDTCIVMHRSYIRRLKTSPLTDSTQRHLDFTSVAAFPVVSPSTSKKLGVLVAFKNVKNGILKQDSCALVQAARLLGMCLG